jgi:outer membrane usher protein
MHLRFAAREGRSGQVRVVLEDGSPAPAGAEVRVLGATDDTVFPVASDGALYLMGVPEVATLQLSWGRQQCQVGLAAGALVASAGKELVCLGVKR